MSRPGRVAAILILSVWSVRGLYLTVVYYQLSQRVGTPLPIAVALGVGFGDAYLWAAVTALVLVITRKFPLGQGPWRRTLFVHLIAGILISTVRLKVFFQVLELTGIRRGGLFHRFYLGEDFVAYGVVLAVVHAFYYAQHFRERDMAAHRLEAELASAQLHILKAQLHPHFFFNTLHAISSLMYTDVRAADRMLSQLADLFRHSLSAFHTQKVTLEHELTFLLPYLQIEQTRLGDRLNLDVDVDPRLNLALVPHLILQPLAENAVRHGIAPRPAGGCLQIRVFSRSDRLCLEVADDGPGSAGASAGTGQGVGLSNTRARLASLYGAAHTLEIQDEAEGFTVRIELPLEFAPAAAEEPMFV